MVARYNEMDDDVVALGGEESEATVARAEGGRPLAGCGDSERRQGAQGPRAGPYDHAHGGGQHPRPHPSTGQRPDVE